MFIHDVIKIKLSEAGYLPGYPPHLISDEEMCDAFLPYEYDTEDPLSGYEACMNASINYFRDNYFITSFESQCTQETYEKLEAAYKDLVCNIAYHLNSLKSSQSDELVLPDWVYSYMLGCVVSINSPIKDKHDLFVMLGTDNLYDEFDCISALACYRESCKWLAKLPQSMKDHRSPTMFGAPHVIKSLRLSAEF